MRKITSKRFGVHEVVTGKYKGTSHTPSQKYIVFIGELSHLEMYLSTHLLPREPEDIVMSSIILGLQNILEIELEYAIETFITANPSNKNRKFLNTMKTDFVSFKRKFEWAKQKGILTNEECEVFEEIRKIRNGQTHFRPTTPQRVKYRYFGLPLISRQAVVKIFTDVEPVVTKLRGVSGSSEAWNVIPPGYAQELWS